MPPGVGQEAEVNRGSPATPSLRGLPAEEEDSEFDLRSIGRLEDLWPSACPPKRDKFSLSPEPWGGGLRLDRTLTAPSGLACGGELKAEVASDATVPLSDSEQHTNLGRWKSARGGSNASRLSLMSAFVTNAQDGDMARESSRAKGSRRKSFPGRGTAEATTVNSDATFTVKEPGAGPCSHSQILASSPPVSALWASPPERSTASMPPRSLDSHGQILRPDGTALDQADEFLNLGAMRTCSPSERSSKRPRTPETPCPSRKTRRVFSGAKGKTGR